MTRNQISYLEHLESKRHNLATERETNRTNLAKEGLEHTKNVETERSHRAGEAFNLDSLTETKRSNQTNELLKLMDVEEKHRSNVALEELKAAANYIQRTYNEGRLSVERDKLDESIRQFNIGQGLRYGSDLLGAAVGYALGKGSNKSSVITIPTKGSTITKGGTKTTITTNSTPTVVPGSSKLGNLGALTTMAAMAGGAIYLGSNYSSKNPHIFHGGKNKDG